MSKMKTNDKKEILESLKIQIDYFDHKSEILLTVVGVFIGLSLVILTTFFDKYNPDKKILPLYFFVLSICYIASAVSVMVLSFMVIYPRKKKNDYFDVNYYLDISKEEDKFREEIENFHEESDYLTRQIIENAEICSKKHHLFVASIWLLIPFGLFFIGILICLSFIVIGA